MKRIYYLLICTLSVLIMLSCKNGRNNSEATDSILARDQSNEAETKPTTPEEAYFELEIGVELLKDSLNFKPEVFDEYSFKDIFEIALGERNTEEFRHSVYSNLKYDTQTLNNLKTIADILMSKSNSDVKNFVLLIESLSHLPSYEFEVIDEQGTILNNNTLTALASSKDLEGLNELTDMLYNMILQREQRFLTIQEIIKDASKSDTKEILLKKIEPLIKLDVMLNDKNCNNVKLCLASKTLSDFPNKISDKVNNLMQQMK
ncbi:hypothetical protein [Borrelia crocidurae]|uniref:Putative lipoprotein n=1 Tax=Borrelia crocidurae (strain Achema) TaxID=1155096 RepID=I0FE06_BORCA|nr:hypothetical protein [Borrelia crocidurae]AFI31712.1 Putative lipoprotein [Borrelia crocidurae str. Achema]